MRRRDAVVSHVDCASTALDRCSGPRAATSLAGAVRREEEHRQQPDLMGKATLAHIRRRQVEWTAALSSGPGVAQVVDTRDPSHERIQVARIPSRQAVREAADRPCAQDPPIPYDGALAPEHEEETRAAKAKQAAIVRRSTPRCVQRAPPSPLAIASRRALSPCSPRWARRHRPPTCHLTRPPSPRAAGRPPTACRRRP